MAGAVLLLIGTLIHLWTAKLLGIWGLVGLPEVYTRQEGRLVSGGVFSVVRHPTYLAHTMMFTGIFMITGVVTVGVITVIDLLVVLLLIIPIEDKELTDRFGEGYRLYRSRVPAILPSFSRLLGSGPIIPGAIEIFALDHTTPLPELLEELQRETHEKMENPQMLTGRVEGRLLQMLVRLSGAKRVVEIGTFTGFSALMMAEGLPDEGELITCEISREFAEVARRYFDRSSHKDKIRLRVGPAINALRGMPNRCADFVFIDADKTSYINYYEEGMRILKSGGLITVDNVLWSGRVLNPRDEDSRAIAEFDRRVMEDSRAEKVMLTVRDGLYLIRKKEQADA
jgi:caffeoyl-CoA O-methyltransferase